MTIIKTYDLGDGSASSSTVTAVSQKVIEGGVGHDGAPGPGVAAGGTTGQVLAKASNTDYDTDWVDAGTGGGAVDSVNGHTGVVVLGASDVGADAAGAAATAQATAEAYTDGKITAEVTRADAAYDPAGSAAAAQAAATAASQPVDSDLTAIAALSTTTFGRALLTQADAAALRAVAGLGDAATHAASDFDAAGAATAAQAAAVASADSYTDGKITAEVTRANAAYDPAGSAAAAQAASQPLDSDLTAIAALTTTSFGRSFLALADAAAARTLLALGTLATQSGTFSGTSSGTNTGDQDLSGLLVKASNLSDLGSAGTARTNLGLGGAATLNVGATTGTVAAGDDSRITGAAADSTVVHLAGTETVTGAKSFSALLTATAGVLASANVQAGIATRSTTQTLSTTPVPMNFCSASGGAITITLPTLTTGLVLWLIKTDSSANAVTVSSNGGDISGSATYALSSQYDWVMIVGNGVSKSWNIVAKGSGQSFIPTSTVTTKGDLIVATASGTVARLGVGSDTQVLTADSTQTAGVKWAAAAGGYGLSIFGDGSDGSPTFDGSTTILSMAPSSSVYTLTRDVFLASPTINNGVQIKTNGFRIFCSGTLTNNGTIFYNGNAASGATAGAAGGNTSGTLLSTTNACAGGGAGATGLGASGTNPGIPSIGGFGGAGGTSGGGQRNPTTPTAVQGNLRTMPWAVLGCTLSPNTSALLPFWAGLGGSGGGGDGTNSGGGGGGGGGPIVICAKVFAGTGTIQSKGGAGGNAVAGNAGGGGGGGGGWIVVVSGSVSGGAISGQTVDVTGGAAGLKSGTGANGSAGGAGTTIILAA